MSAVLQKDIAEIPLVKDYDKILFYVIKNKVNSSYLSALSKLTDLSDETIADWLNITSRTLRTYRKERVALKENMQEHITFLIALHKHGTDVFSSKENFDKWLTTENVLLNRKKPADFLNTISGIKFIDDRLTAIEYGDNV